jgi:hypothetical protein
LSFLVVVAFFAKTHIPRQTFFAEQ